MRHMIPASTQAAHIVPPEKDAYTVEEFCQRNAISKSELYEQWRSGVGPRVMKRGSRWVRISREAAAEWRRRMEGGAESLPGEDPSEAA